MLSNASSGRYRSLGPTVADYSARVETIMATLKEHKRRMNEQLAIPNKANNKKQLKAVEKVLDWIQYHPLHYLPDVRYITVPFTQQRAVQLDRLLDEFELLRDEVKEIEKDFRWRFMGHICEEEILEANQERSARIRDEAAMADRGSLNYG